MSNDFEVVSVNVSEAKGTVKAPAGRIELDSTGVVGDAHAGVWHRQVSLLGQASIDRFTAETGRAVKPGEFAENLTISGVDLTGAAVLDRFRIGTVELEVTQIGKECHGDACTIFREVGRCVMPKEGLFARVLSGGTIGAGDEGQYLPRPLQVRVITLSDRAAAGEYADRSGPRLREILAEFFAPKRWHAQIDSAVLSDDPDALRKELTAATEAGVDVVLTTGGTGVGPRDTAPETAAGVCDKLIPGIMEHVRAKFGADKPNALLSRGIAGVAGTMQIYTLPGSVRAVEEYAGEILKTLEHVLLMLHGLDVH